MARRVHIDKPTSLKDHVRVHPKQSMHTVATEEDSKDIGVLMGADGKTDKDRDQLALHWYVDGVDQARTSSSKPERHGLKSKVHTLPRTTTGGDRTRLDTRTRVVTPQMVHPLPLLPRHDDLRCSTASRLRKGQGKSRTRRELCSRMAEDRVQRRAVEATQGEAWNPTMVNVENLFVPRR